MSLDLSSNVIVLHRLSGYLFKKVSRTAAFLVGCSFLAIQVRTSNDVNHFLHLSLSLSLSPPSPPPSEGAVAVGVINVNWGRRRRAAERRISSVQRLAGNNSRANIVEQVQGSPLLHLKNLKPSLNYFNSLTVHSIYQKTCLYIQWFCNGGCHVTHILKEVQCALLLCYVNVIKPSGAIAAATCTV